MKRVYHKLQKKHKVLHISDSVRNEKKPDKRKRDEKKNKVKCDYCASKVSYGRYLRHLESPHPAVPKSKAHCPICNKEVFDVVLKNHKIVCQEYYSSKERDTFVKKECMQGLRVKCHLCEKNHCLRLLSPSSKGPC